VANSGNFELYIPKQGDIVWIDFTPKAGREQGGSRPALVISRSRSNRRIGLAVVCPITKQIKGYPFEVPIPEGLAVSGVVLVDQVKSLDWQARAVEFACKAPTELTVNVIKKLRLLTPLPQPEEGNIL